MKPSEILDKALTEVIPDESRWCQDALFEGGDRCCLAGAMMIAADAMRASNGTPEHLDYMAARAAVMRVLLERGEGQSVPRFNDSHTYDEVRAVMEKARAGLQEAGQ